MARKKGSKNRKTNDYDPSERVGFWNDLKDETKHSVKGVVYFLFTLILIAAALHKGGVAGEMFFNGLSYCFGVGYYILPVILIIFSISAFRGEARKIALPQTIGALVFFLSALGLIQISSAGRAGIVGEFIANPLIRVFDVYVSIIILVALLVISFSIFFDTTIRFGFLSSLFRKNKDLEDEEDEEHTIKVSIGGEEVDEEENEEDEEESGEPTPKISKVAQVAEFVASMPKTLFAKEFTPPPLSLLERDRGKPGVGDVKANANIIKRTLENFGIAVEMDEVSIGPSVTRYALKPAEGVKLSKIVGLQNNLELALAAHPVRIEAPIPGKSLVGIEVPNTAKTTVGLGSLLSENNFIHGDKDLLVALGKDISGISHFVNLAKMPHLLIAGATGSGKSVTIHALITSLLYRNPPENLKFIMIDPKRVELTLYNNIPHLLTPVITEAKKAILALKWAAKEMDRRYDLLQTHGARDIDSYHKSVVAPAIEKARKNKNDQNEDNLDPMPYIVVVIDELADIMQAYPRELESAIVRLAQMSRAVGIHLMLSTQRPSVNVITGLIKANVPSRIALQVASQVDSRTILDMAGAEKLLGAGDMLYMGGEMGKPVRIQSAYITESEVKKVAKYLKDSYEPSLSPINFAETKTDGSIFSADLEKDEPDDDLYEEARETVIQAGKASTSFLQRKLGIGYARAARLIDMLEERGVVGPGSGAKPRDVLIGGSSDLENVEEDVAGSFESSEEEKVADETEE
ncbi:MAG: DNA translocase FtsK 4TM domain-containing protein [Minisyncoccia bacterium]